MHGSSRSSKQVHNNPVQRTMWQDNECDWTCFSCYTPNWSWRTNCRWCNEPDPRIRANVRRWNRHSSDGHTTQAHPDLQEPSSTTQAHPNLQELSNIMRALPHLQEPSNTTQQAHPNMQEAMMRMAMEVVIRNPRVLSNLLNPMPTQIHIAPNIMNPNLTQPPFASNIVNPQLTGPAPEAQPAPTAEAQQAQPARPAEIQQARPAPSTQVPPPPASPAPSTQVHPPPPPPPGPPPQHQQQCTAANLARWCRLNEDLGGGLYRWQWTKQQYEDIFGELSAENLWGDKVWQGLQKTIRGYWEYRLTHKSNNSHSTWVPGDKRMHPWLCTFRPPANFGKTNAARPQGEDNPPGDKGFPAVVYLSHAQHSIACQRSSSSSSSSSNSSGSSSTSNSGSGSSSSSSSSSTSSTDSSSIPDTGEPVCVVCLGILVNAGQCWWVWGGWIEIHAVLEQEEAAKDAK